MKLLSLAFGAVVLALSIAPDASLMAQRPTASPPTFNKDVAPILFNNCVTCHRPNQIAPMALRSGAKPLWKATEETATTRVFASMRRSRSAGS